MALWVEQGEKCRTKFSGLKLQLPEEPRTFRILEENGHLA